MAHPRAEGLTGTPSGDGLGGYATESSGMADVASVSRGDGMRSDGTDVFRMTGKIE
ncbi:MAG: hypothetical protein WAY93_05420 [Atopobiaceae bacterium]|jgi:hypothetical protein|nr:hypothetical protein [Atopobiaceae bacterium]